MSLTMSLRDVSIMANAAPGRVRTIVKVTGRPPVVLYVPAIDAHGNFDEVEYASLCGKLHRLLCDLYPTINTIEVARG